jgi:hypothetical protein
VSTQVTPDRLNDQISWYDKRSQSSQHWYKRLKLLEIGVAAAVPLMIGLDVTDWISGGLAVAVVVIEGIQQLNQFHHNWISYRSTAEALKHEKYLHAVRAGDYDAAENPDKLLAERVEGLVSQEHAAWVAVREPAEKPVSAKKGPT